MSYPSIKREVQQGADPLSLELKYEKQVISIFPTKQKDQEFLLTSSDNFEYSRYLAISDFSKEELCLINAEQMGH